MPGDPGATVVTNACVLLPYTRGCGCNGHPAFPTPSLGEGFTHNSGASRREIAESYLAVIASEAKQSIKQESKDGLLRRFAPRNDGLISELLRIASRSLSSGAHSRDPLARNDGRERNE